MSESRIVSMASSWPCSAQIAIVQQFVPARIIFKRKIRIVAMDTDKNTGLNFVAPDGEIRMVGVNHFLGVDLGDTSAGNPAWE